MRQVLWWLMAFWLMVPALSSAEVGSFREAKKLLKEHVYFDQNRGQQGTFYCGCNWKWVGESGGRTDMASCGYQVRAQQNRAERTEWEHVLPSWTMGHQRQCWQNGGRQNCVATDPVFRAMESDLHNLVIAVGEVNADRSNYSFGTVQRSQGYYGQCSFKVDFKARMAEPRDAVKGRVARIYFYMHDRYGLNMSRQQQQLLMAWDRMFPVDAWERERDARIARVVGRHNPFVTGERHWTLGHRPTRDGLGGTATLTRADSQREVFSAVSPDARQPIRGNRNSRVFHLPQGCPSYDAMSPRNIVNFSSEAEALSAGYRKAGNCS